MTEQPTRLYTSTFYFALAYNFLIGMNFTNNAVLPLYVKELGGTAETVGLFMGTAAVAAVIMRPIIGALLDRIGTKPVLIAGSLLLAIAPLGYWLLLDSGLGWPVYVVRALHGFGFGAHFSAFFTLAATTAPPGRRNEAIGMYGISGLAAHLVGPYFGELIYDTQGLPGFFLFISFFPLIGAVTVLFMKPVSQTIGAGAVPPSFTGALKLIVSKRMRLPFTLSMMLSVCFSSAQFFLAPLARDRAIASFGLYFTGFAIAGMTVRVLSRKWGDRFGVRRVLIPGFLLYATGMVTIGLSEATHTFVIAGVISGMAHGVVFPAVGSLSVHQAPPEYAGSAVALSTGMSDFGSILTAFLFGLAAEWYGYGIVFALAATAGLTASSLAVVSILRKPETIQVKRS